MGLGSYLTRQAAPAAELRQSSAMDSFLFNLEAAQASGSISGDNYRAFLSIPGVERATSLICGVMASVQWDAYRDYGGRPVEKLDPSNVPFLNDPCPPLTQFDVVTSMTLDYLMHGCTYSVITSRDQNGNPTGYLPVPAWSVSVLTFTDQPYYLCPPDLRRYRIGGLELGPNDLLRICAPSAPGSLRGQGVIERHFDTMALARNLNKQAQHVINEGGVPTGIVSHENPDAVEADVSELRASWMERMKYRGVAFTNGQVKWTPVAWNPTDSQLIEARAFSLTEISLIFGLPGHFLESGPANSDGLKYSTTVMEADELLKFGKPAEMIIAFEQAFSRKLPNGTECIGSTDTLMRSDPVARSQIATAGIQDGWLLRSEVRESERLPRIAGIDDPPTPSPAAPAAQPGMSPIAAPGDLPALPAVSGNIQASDSKAGK